MSRQSAWKKEAAVSTISAVDRQLESLFASADLSRKLLNLVPMPLLVINRAWRVVYANASVLKMLSPPGQGKVYGFREGEAFHCVHGRSGTSPSPSPMCRVCGMAKAVAASLAGRDTVSDCRISCDLAGDTHSLDLRVWAAPLVVGGETLSFVALADISDEKRRAVLENICFHDLLNTLTGIRGVLDVLSHSDVTELPDICQTLNRMTQNSIEDIGSLRFLAQAEQSTLQVVWEGLETRDFLQDALQSLSSHPVCANKKLVLHPDAADLPITSDPRLLRRVVENLLLNALEATAEGGTVTLGCEPVDNQVELWVHNESSIPYEIQLQVFQRSFSTKGGGRGIGTYSIKLLTAYLKGSVRFSSTPKDGTTFRVTLPVKPPP